MNFIPPFIDFINDLGSFAVLTAADFVTLIGALVRSLLEIVFLGGQVSP